MARLESHVYDLPTVTVSGNREELGRGIGSALSELIRRFVPMRFASARTYMGEIGRGDIDSLLAAGQRCSRIFERWDSAAFVEHNAVAAAAGAIASMDAPAFYARLDRPGWAPPASVFGPVWSVLYLLMGVAAWLVWRERRRLEVDLPLALYLVQLGANALWSWLFFAWHRGALAFGEVLLLLVLIAATTGAFWRVRPLAGMLLLPYLGWVGFASVLTWAMWQRNPGLL